MGSSTQADPAHSRPAITYPYFYIKTGCILIAQNMKSLHYGIQDDGFLNLQVHRSLSLHRGNTKKNLNFFPPPTSFSSVFLPFIFFLLLLPFLFFLSFLYSLFFLFRLLLPPISTKSFPPYFFLFCVCEIFSRVVSIPTSFSGSPGFKSRPGNRVF
jgi:hypothetical protein